ncbi:EAL domain-containing protein [Paenibacillus alkaliterrae]|uniref:EAL domain-containing protein n=1 Tax=Paenibacillus alkaliterrae TaxID=320909 RepID=UPI001F16AB27|nr:EAL domain-containing protein [Paenibacillus alkaliterrae]MCF2938331.1 EAL domain-containing protein [Paenibacillus alkaliterrae]
MPKIEQLIIQNDFYHVFQPIYSFPGKRVLGYEALIRSKSNMVPDMLFQHAMEQNKLFEMDSFSILQAISTYFGTQRSSELRVLFINIFPSTLVSPLFIGFLETLAIQYEPYRTQIVFEINESIIEGVLWKSASFRDAIRMMRELNFLIAFDDVGEGTASFRNILDISPDFIKIDRFFSADLCTTEKKQKVVALFVEYCRDESGLILEGIENEEDLAVALSLGIKMGQGYLLGKPNPLT